MRPVIVVALADEAAREQMVDEMQRYARDYRIVPVSSEDEHRGSRPPTPAR